MKQQMKTKLITELSPAGWHLLEDDTAILVVVKRSDDSGESRQTTLGDLKRYILSEILDALEKRGA